MIRDKVLPRDIEQRFEGLGTIGERWRTWPVRAATFRVPQRDGGRTQRIIERTFQMSIETCIDVANHIIADRNLRVPATYADTFDVLAEARILDPALHAVMVRMCVFRNLIVHDYARLEPAKVIRVPREGPPDLERFRIAALE